MAVDNDHLELLDEIRRWLKLNALDKVKDKFDRLVLNDDKMTEKDNLIIFHLSDGDNSTKEISKYVSVSRETVRTRQKEWASAGLLEKKSSYSPYNKLVQLDELGISVPDIEDIDE